MIPDTMIGGVLLSVVNMSVVFLVLGFLAVLIGFIAKIVNGKGSRGEDDGQGGSPEDKGDGSSSDNLSSQEDEPGFEVSFSQSIDPNVKAAISAAISFCLSDSSRGPVFVRKIDGSGAWGKSFRNYSPMGLKQ